MANHFSFKADTVEGMHSLDNNRQQDVNMEFQDDDDM